MTLDPEKNPNVDPRQCSYSHYERAEKLLIAMMAAGQLKLDTVDPKKGTDSGVGQIKTNLDTFFLMERRSRQAFVAKRLARFSFSLLP